MMVASTIVPLPINGDKVWSICEAELKRGNAPATVNRYLAVIRSILRMARDEWQWIDTFPHIRLLPGEVERDRWLIRGEADRLIAACPVHLVAIVRFALTTGCRSSEIWGATIIVSGQDECRLPGHAA